MQKFNVNDLQEFSADKRVRKTLSKEGKIEVDLIFYEPGQSSPEHAHKHQDEIFYVVSGEGSMVINGEKVSVKEKDIILAPSGTTHGINNDSSSQLSLLFVKNKRPQNV
ncbi:cupin domain-containing protein [Metallumcola ferriviriculae]|uniref:Cupin domain-containing protein n=1 Tax=Metallumcola ferriviriculae TaxID=3039180 RepID=A0AAU0UUW2_9FIRM|nr:cupin domain-containing protein [Desulfitibacteraceae bacterium MK1]